MEELSSGNLSISMHSCVISHTALCKTNADVYRSHLIFLQLFLYSRLCDTTPNLMYQMLSNPLCLVWRVYISRQWLFQKDVWLFFFYCTHTDVHTNTSIQNRQRGREGERQRIGGRWLLFDHAAFREVTVTHQRRQWNYTQKKKKLEEIKLGFQRYDQ